MRMNRHQPRISCAHLAFLVIIAGSVLGFRFGFKESNSVSSTNDNVRAISENHEMQLPDLASDLEERLQGVSSSNEPDREESSCYSRIFGALTNQGKSTTPEPSLCSVLGRSEAHRTAFAARLTICELETNRLTLPRECTLWIEGGSEPTSPKLQACVGALHASPQSWSSFTGHQREAVQLCFARHKLQGIELATSLNLETIKFSTDMIRLGRLDHQSNQEDLRKLRDHMRSLFDQSIQSFHSVSESNRQESQKIFQELENRFQDVKNHLYERNEQMWKEFNSHQNQQIDTLHDRVQSLNNNHELKVNENVNNFIQTMKKEVEQKIQSSLDSAAVGMIENLKKAFEVESRSNSANVNHQIKQAFDAALDLATQRHHRALEESITLQSRRMSALFDELLSVESILSSMKQNLDSIRISSTDREGALRDSSAKIEEQQRKGEELINRFMESMASHQAMIQNLSDSVSNSPLFISYSFFNRTGIFAYPPSGKSRGVCACALVILEIFSISKLKMILGWLACFVWMSGGMNWLIRIGLSKAAMLVFFLAVRMPLRWLRRKMSSDASKRELRPKRSRHDISHDDNDKLGPDDPGRILPASERDDAPTESPRQVFVSCAHSDPYRQANVRRKFSSQSLGGSRIVPTRLIGTQAEDGA
ncbi:hypothetical protein PtA15_1A714 [Puccinia triticina]|uniref:Nuclear fusion protein KAR5 n=1 Tax=Puccinia triticina TaxID=208348 RepID=A0ABY7CAF7_9BASI|nr:uncharacterized protein PtA15_1A714 [Puccinia triticina]WAQ81373.1 hypothetical protein PtA15_1A714 [Puccinia triticina]WAR52257.1 hypothetical protein PtB15_1B698 [Puccinia triticina]